MGLAGKKNTKALNTRELCSMRKKLSHDQLGLLKVLTYLLWKCALGNAIWKKWVGEKLLVFKLGIIPIQLH